MSDANVVYLNCGKETTQGVPASYENLLQIRYTGEGFNSSPELTSTEEVNSNLRESDQIMTAYNAEGSVDFALSNAPQFHRFIPAALLATGDELMWGGGTYEVSVTGAEVSVVITAGPPIVYTLTCAAADAVFTGLSIGQWIRLTGFTEDANNTFVKIANINTIADPHVVTVEEMNIPLVAEVATAVGIEGSMIRDGRDASWGLTNPKTTFFFEKGIPATNDSEAVYHLFTGEQISSINMDFQPNALVTGSVSFIGTGLKRQATPYTISSVDDTSEVFNAASFKTVIRQDGSAIQVTGMSFTLGDLARARNTVGAFAPTGTGRNSIIPEVTLSTYYSTRKALEDSFDPNTGNLVQKNVSAKCETNDGAAFIVTFPRVTMVASLPSGAKNEDLMIDGNAAYTYHPISGEMYTIQVDRFKPLA